MKKILFALAALFILGAAIGFYRSERVRTEQWRRVFAQTPALEGKPAALREGIETALARGRRLWPDAGTAGELALYYYMNGFLPEAEAAMAAAVEAEPKNALWPHLLAGHYAGYGRLDEAVFYYARAAALAPDYLPTQIKWADALLKHNEPVAAKAAYQAVLARDPANPYAQLGLARIELAAGDRAGAIRRLETAAAASPQFSTVFSLLATVREQQGDKAGAETARARSDELGRFIEVTDPWAEGLMAYCYDTYRLRVTASSLGFAGRASEAVALLERAVSLKPDEAQTYTQLGRTFLEMKDPVRAYAQFERALSRDPREATAYLKMLDILKSRRDLAGAERLFERALRHCPDSSGVQFEYALLLTAQGRLVESLPHFQEAERLQPEDMAAYQHHAITCFRLGREGEGLKILEAAHVREPYDAEIIALLVRYHLRQTHEAEAGALMARLKRTKADPAMREELEMLFQRTFGRSAR